MIPGCCKADWKENVIDAFMFVAGIATSHAVHEIGHELTARAYGEKLDWPRMEWTCRPPCTHHDKIAMAGNISTAILGEALFLLPAIYKHTPFVDGMQTFNTINPIAYLYKQETETGGYGDYQNLSDDYKKYEVALAIHAATIGYRQLSDRLWSITVAPRHIHFTYKF